MHVGSGGHSAIAGYTTCAWLDQYSRERPAGSGWLQTVDRSPVAGRIDSKLASLIRPSRPTCPTTTTTTTATRTAALEEQKQVSECGWPEEVGESERARESASQPQHVRDNEPAGLPSSLIGPGERRPILMIEIIIIITGSTCSPL